MDKNKKTEWTTKETKSRRSAASADFTLKETMRPEWLQSAQENTYRVSLLLAVVHVEKCGFAV